MIKANAEGELTLRSDASAAEKELRRLESV